MALPKLLRVAVMGRTYELPTFSDSTLVRELQDSLAGLTGLQPSTMKLFLPHKKGFLRLDDASDFTLEQAGEPPTP